MALVIASLTARSIPKAASSLIPARLTISATADAASATDSMRLGNLNSVFSIVTTRRHNLSKSHFVGPWLLIGNVPKAPRKFEGLTRGPPACQEVGQIVQHAGWVHCQGL